MEMVRYKNLGYDSGIRSFQIGDHHIVVRFADGATYEYTNQSAGINNVQMKMLALNGRGLNSFINRNVKKRYSRKLSGLYY
jgi:hypothetical protein